MMFNILHINISMKIMLAAVFGLCNSIQLITSVIHYFIYSYLSPLIRKQQEYSFQSLFYLDTWKTDRWKIWWHFMNVDFTSNQVCIYIVWPKLKIFTSWILLSIILECNQLTLWKFKRVQNSLNSEKI